MEGIRTRRTRKSIKTRPLFSTLSPLISGFRPEYALLRIAQKREILLYIMHKGIMNDSVDTSLEKQRQTLETFFLA